MPATTTMSTERNDPPSGSSKHSDMPPTIQTTFLIVGAGPAGASLASFLASYGMKGLVVAAAAGTAKEPRAHITNAAALECLRDIGLEEEAKNNATSGDCQYAPVLVISLGTNIGVSC